MSFTVGEGKTIAVQILLHEQSSCAHMTQCYCSGSFFKIKAWNYVWRLLTPWGSVRKRNLVHIHLNGAMEGYGRWSFQNRSHFLFWFFSGFRLQCQFCYTHIQYFDRFGNFRVFSILNCQLYAYSSIWSGEIGCLLWERYFSKHKNSAP